MPNAATKQLHRVRIQFGMKAFLAFVTVCAVFIGLFFPRIGTPLSGCAGQGQESVWIAPPDRADILRKCKELHPDAIIPDQPTIITEKVFEEVERCNILNFQGRRYLHRVRYRSELFLTNTFPYESLVVMFDYDHYHLNGDGCELCNAKNQVGGREGSAQSGLKLTPSPRPRYPKRYAASLENR